MGGAWRIQYEGGLYHVLSRGNEQKDIFHDDRDRLTFLDVIAEMADQYHVNVLAYSLITHHHHILLRWGGVIHRGCMLWVRLCCLFAWLRCRRGSLPAKISGGCKIQNPALYLCGATGCSGGYGPFLQSLSRSCLPWFGFVTF